MKFTRALALTGTLAISGVLINTAAAQQVDHSQHGGAHTTQPDHSVHGNQHTQQADHSQHGGQMGQQMSHQMGHQMGRHMMNQASAASQPTEAGQDAFAAIQEIVSILSADPATDWSKVNIDALRDHLVDMHRVTLYAQVAGEQIEGGMRYTVTGDTETAASIKRMVTAHARQVSQDSGWSAATSELVNGVTLVVTTDHANDVAKIRGLGFAGFMVQGNHHQPHHLMMATGGFGGHQH
ncbi:MAG: hypothetical protein Q7L19_14690 [Pseudohongiella sp.]|nr:hypothetical protein [Pseudohongiella sp.]